MSLVVFLLLVISVLALVVHQRAHRIYMEDRRHIAEGIHEFHGFEFLGQLLSQKKKRHEFLQRVDGVAVIVLVFCLVSLGSIAFYGFIDRHIPQAAFVVQQETTAFWALFGVR